MLHDRYLIYDDCDDIALPWLGKETGWRRKIEDCVAMTLYEAQRRIPGMKTYRNIVSVEEALLIEKMESL